MTKLDVVRAETFVAQMTNTDPGTVSVPVVGGHAGVTILPLLSQARRSADFHANTAGSDLAPVGCYSC